MKNSIIIIITIVIAFAVIFLLFIYGSKSVLPMKVNDRVCATYKRVVHARIEGQVVKAFVDHENHNFKKVLINDGKQINCLYLDLDRSGLFNYVEKGDSILKATNTNIVHIYRNQNDTLFNLDYGCVQ